MEKSPKFQRPYWLEGKVYTVSQTVPELSIFNECIARTGLDEIINVSGLYTVMAPTDDAFDAFFAQHPQYNSIDDIDSTSLIELVKMHIVLKSWSKDQLRLLSTHTGGWIDPEDDDADFTGFKRETFLKPSNKKYKVQEAPGFPSTISSSGNAVYSVFSEYNKFAPVFYSEYMDYTRVSSSDFEFYYDRPFESSEIFYAGAKLISTGMDLNDDGEIDDGYPAENGYVYLIDRVIEPLPSAEDFLSGESSENQYSVFGNLVNEFATFSYNEDATYAQEGANEGLAVDKLYDIVYPSLSFNIADESTAPIPVYSIAYHNALFAPTNEVYNSFIDNVITSGSDHYSEVRNIPDVLKQTIVDAHMAPWRPYYPSQAVDRGLFYNALGEKVLSSEVSAVEAVFGSNATLVGVDKVIVPGMFKSVAAPIALRQSYKSFFGGLYFSGLFSIVNNLSSEFTLLAISDKSFERDSTLMLRVSDDLINGYEFESCEVYNRTEEVMESFSVRQSVPFLRGLINGQIALGTPQGICKKEYLRTLTGFYMEFDNENMLVSGGVPTAFGYMGNSADSAIQLDLNVELKEDYGSVYGTAPANGKVYKVESWLTFPSEFFKSSSLKIQGQTMFYELMDKAGLLNPSTYRFNFLTEGEALTVFIPTDAALATAQADTLQGEELIDFLQRHFVTGANLFTDNISKNPVVEAYFTKNGKSLKLGSSNPDEIDIINGDGSIYYTIKENGARTNNMYLGWDNGDNNDGSSVDSKKQAGISVITHMIDSVIPSSAIF